MSFSFKRFRHRRTDEATRERYREHRLSKSELILPLFIVPGSDREEAIDSMPGVYRRSIDRCLQYLHRLVEQGLHSVLVFGVADRRGIEQAWDDRGVVQEAVRTLRNSFGTLEIITDVCLCSYSPDGHCHIGDNDETCSLLAKIACSHARAGAHIIAPSDMMDGRVATIRAELDRTGFSGVPVMSYSAKFASAYYGPFRDAARCAPQHGDRRTYQIDPPNGNEALEEIGADIDEGAASIIVKPSVPYLDVIARAADSYSVPVTGYHVSGEYAMLKRAVSDGTSSSGIILETLTGIKRAGASRIITYFTPELLEVL